MAYVMLAMRLMSLDDPVPADPYRGSRLVESTAPAEPQEAAAIPEHVGQKLQTIVELFARGERRVGRHQLAIERVTEIVGRPSTAYALFSAMLAWTAANGIATAYGARALDPPPFVWLQMTSTVAALLMTVAILTTQNRVASLTQQRAQLDLQVNLIAEEKIAKLIALLEELRRDLPSVRNRQDPLADAMTESVDLDAVADKLGSLGSRQAEPRHTLHDSSSPDRTDDGRSAD